MTSHVFGPVPSRRLGRSLGVDLVPFKTCTYDCVYCQVGRTTCKGLERKAWVPIDEVVEQIRQKLPSSPDYITLAGSGEPTLFLGIGELVARIKQMTSTPISILTNGSLLWMPEVRKDLLDIDLVVPSLDAGDEALFRKVNRPHDALSFDRMVEGLVAFRKEYSGQYWLEVFLVGGLTACRESVQRMAEIVRRINPDRVQVNTVARPPAEKSAVAVPKEEMERFAQMLGDNVEVIADYKTREAGSDFRARRQDTLEMLRRRPCTVEDIANGLGMHPNEAIKYVEELIAEGEIEPDERDGKTYYVAADSPRS